RVALTRDASRGSPAQERRTTGVSSIDLQVAEQRRLEQRRSPGGSGGGGGGGARGGGGGGGAVRGGSPGGAAGPRVAVPRSAAPGGRGYNGGGRYYGGGGRYYGGGPYYGRAYYGSPYYYPYYAPYYYPYYSSYFGGYYYDSYAWGSVGFGVGWGGPGLYGGYPAYGGYGYGLGRLRLQVSQRDAEVFIDGYYAGQVDDFDGRLQGLDLETGGYSVEVRKAGWETLTFDVRVTPGRTTTYKAELIPQKP
ncbi:MAG TPA: PEGA domain-containing protein, partial [Vicinamibacterales bacterium]